MKKFFLFIIIILLNLTLRIFFSINTPPQGDIIVHQEWAKVLSSQGLSGSYFLQNWTYTPPTQPPLMMIAFSKSGWIYQNRNILSAIHNLVKFPTASMLLAFQKYGEILSLQIWELLATYLIAFILFFYLSKKTSFKKAFFCFLLIIFNPISLFINSIWGQNDILPTAFMYSSFISIFSNFIFLSPVLFLVGILFKPTIALITPLFIFVFLYKFSKNQPCHSLLKIIFSIVLCLSILYLSFKPFIPSGVNQIDYINDIVKNRIQTSSKGLKMASVSAFNFYSLFWDIDKTYATHDGSLIQLKDISILLIVIINFFFILKLYKSQKINFNSTLFYIYFISQGTFLFMTNMLDRYFIPAFISSTIIMVLYWKKYGWLMFIQQFIWFLNIIYSYYYRSNDLINFIFRSNNFFFIRLLAFANIFIYFYISKSFFSKILVKKKYV